MSVPEFPFLIWAKFSRLFYGLMKVNKTLDGNSCHAGKPPQLGLGIDRPFPLVIKKQKWGNSKNLLFEEKNVLLCKYVLSTFRVTNNNYWHTYGFPYIIFHVYDWYLLRKMTKCHIWMVNNLAMRGWHSVLMRWLSGVLTNAL